MIFLVTKNQVPVFDRSCCTACPRNCKASRILIIRSGSKPISFCFKLKLQLTKKFRHFGSKAMYESCRRSFQPYSFHKSSFRVHLSMKIHNFFPFPAFKIRRSGSVTQNIVHKHNFKQLRDYL